MNRFLLFVLVPALTAGCVVIGADSDGRISYSGGEVGMYCTGSIDQNNHYCSVDSRRVLEKISAQRFSSSESTQ
ncbi:hypothetical protein [Polycyclovorans algicola]|uniref:hypothetical protein n=1 Tax=Polycyclovorans algicola TaxID=616992 RepID=UPI0004A77288|nr:hypothetical protein [Polycyclovorans algicola]